MKNIDPKSVLIGVLATALVIACTDSSKPTSIIPEAKAATSKEDRGTWDDEQKWKVVRGGKANIGLQEQDGPKGMEPFSISVSHEVYYRRRIN